MEQTLVLIKPDAATNEDMVKTIITLLESSGNALIAKKRVLVNKQFILEHYRKDEAWLAKAGKKIYNHRLEAGLIISEAETALQYSQVIMDKIADYMTSGPVIVMIFEGEDAVNGIRSIVGKGEPISAEPHTIRHLFSLDSYEKADNENRSIRNIIHCSDKPEEAHREIMLWFPE